MNDIEIRNGFAHYECGCKFEVLDSGPPVRLSWDARLEYLPLECQRTWNLIGEGNTKGVFQLETRFGQQYAKRLKPENIEQLAALNAIMRPGCLSSSSKIVVSRNKHPDGNLRYTRTTIKDLYEIHHRNHQSYGRNIISYDESSHRLVDNKIVDVMYNGKRAVHLVKYKHSLWNNRCNNHKRNYNLKCTMDHPLYVWGQGWTQLQHIDIGDRFLVTSCGYGYKKSRTLVEHQTSFRDVCFRQYVYKCVLCDWEKASLDVNHLTGNRNTDNSANNLCFLCPNHHRMYGEGFISETDIVSYRKTLTLPQNKDLFWAEFRGSESIGIEDVFDIEVEGPHHNFIANDTIVHNCIQVKRDGKNVAEHYMDRKNGLEEVTFFHESLEPILGPTFGEMIYQEQAMKIATDIAGFNLQQADVLRKAIGKKKADIMALVKVEFIDGCAKEMVVTQDQAEELFGWIEKSQRYSFNKSHAVSYAINGYLSAYAKAHFPVSFFTSYLWYSKDKQKKFDEIKLLIANTRVMGISVLPPDFRHTNSHFKRIHDKLNDKDVYNPYDDKIYFGFADIKGIGEKAIDKLSNAIYTVETALGKTRDKWTWVDFLVYFSQEVSSTIITGMIEAGALDYMEISRTQMLFDYEQLSKLTSKEHAWIKQRIRNATSLTNLIEKALHPHNNPVKGAKGADKGPCANKNRVQKMRDTLHLVKNPPYSMKDSPDWIARVEEAKMGISITASVLDSCKNSDQANCTILDFQRRKEKNSGIFIACRIDEVKTHIIRDSGKEMAFLMVSDGESEMDCVVFSNTWDEIKIKGICVAENTVMISGERSRDRDGFIIKNLWQLT